MRLASAVLKTPIQLRGRPTALLPGEEADIDLEVNYERQVLEVHQGGKLVRVVPLADVGPMIPADKGYRCSHPGCAAAFDDPKGLGPHMRHKHGTRADGAGSSG